MPNQSRQILHVKKYPNRRFYDTTRSRHVTLLELHDLIVAGTDVVITDSKTEEDISNLVLTQIILEHDEPKLSLLPSGVLHLIIRSNRQALRQWFDSFFGPYAKMLSTSQRQFDAFLRQTMPNLPNPLTWSDMFQAAPASRTGSESPEDSDLETDTLNPTSDHQHELSDLRRQLAELTQRLDELTSRPPEA